MKWFKRSATAEVPNHLQNYLHVVRSEQIEDSFYWYDADSGVFITQGRTDEEIRTGLRQCWPDHIFVINDRQMIMGPEFDHVIDFNSTEVSL